MVYNPATRQESSKHWVFWIANPADPRQYRPELRFSFELMEFYWGF